MLSDEYIKNTNKEVVHIFYEAFSHYVETAVNLHQYTKVTIEQNNRIGNSCFEELKSKYSNDKLKQDINNVEKFLNKMVEEMPRCIQRLWFLYSLLIHLPINI